MKNYQSKFQTRVFGIPFYFYAAFLFAIFISCPDYGLSQVTFTQTTDADFTPGYLDNVQVSGNDVYLMTKATAINNWLSTTDLPQTLSGHQTAKWKSYIYLSGGYNGIDFSNLVYRATLSGTGNSAWTAMNSVPEPLTNHAMVCGLNYMYIIGGRTDGIPSDKIYFAKINSDGTLGEWVQSTNSLPQPIWGHTAYFQNGFIYVIGGTNLASETSAVNTVYYAKIAGINGELTAFSSGASLPDARNGHAMAFYDEHLIVTGGFDNGGTKQSTVYYTEINLDGSILSWTTSAALTEAVSNHSSTCYNGLITIIGGETTGGLSDKIYYADIDGFPALTWNLATDLLYEARKNGSAYTYNGVVNFTGGENISGQPIHNARFATVTLGTGKVHFGTFLSYPFFQLGEERDIVSLTYNIAYNSTLNNYNLLYRTAGSDQLWGDWVEMNQNNPALVGEHKQFIQYLVKYDGSSDANIVLHDMSVNISGYTQLSGNLNAWTTLSLADSPFWVTGDISFTAGTHYIEPGVNILFSPNTGLEIGQANMTFDGTLANPIILTSYSAEAGLWNGVYFNTNSDASVASVLNYVTIEKAGAGSRNANLYCLSTNEPQINNSTFSMAVGNGVWLNDSDLSIESTEFSGNTENGCYIQNSSPSFSNTAFISNENAGIYLVDLTSNPNFFNCVVDGNYFGIYYPSPNFSFPVISGITSYNNIISGIAIGGGTISSDQTWPYNPLGYAVIGDVIVAKQNTHSRLTIMPGNTIYFDTLVQLQVGNYIYYNQQYGGELFAVGKADSVITFTSINGQPGGWDGIYFHYNSDSYGSVSELINCNIQNGNSYNVRCEGTLQPRIDSCIIINSMNHDIYVQDPNSVPYITASSSTVYIDGGTQSLDKTWYNFGGGGYIILNDIIVAKQDSKATLTIQPGITVKADTSALLQIAQYVYYNQQYGGELFAEGTPDSIITFTSRNGLAGGWDGIYFHYNSDSYGSSSSLKYCTVENGKNFNIKSEGSAQPRIDQCTINNSNGYDIYAVAPNDVQHITNTLSTVYVGAGTQSINKKWYYFGGEYNIVGDIIIAKQNDTVRLTIEPGNTIKVDTTFNIQVAKYVYFNNNFGGELFAEGKADSLITFTSRNGLVGGWDGIYFHDYSDSFGSKSSLNYCTIENGDAYNIYCENTVQPRIDNCTINNSAGYDIYALNPNSVPHVSMTNSTIYIGTGTQSLNKTWYNYGGEYIVLGDIIVAKQNSFCTLTIEPGINIKVDSSATLQIGNYIYFNQNYGGEIIAEGTYDSLITFSSLNPVTDRWDGIYFHEFADNYGGHSSFKYCIIQGATTNNLNAFRTNILDFEHVTFSNSGENGILLTESSPYLKLCQVVNNDSTGIKLVTNSHPVIGDTLGFGCDLYGNGNFDVYNQTTQTIHAKNNFWNVTDSASIAARIYDFYDLASNGIVEFMPFATSSFFNNHPPNEFNLISMTNYFATTDQTPDFTWEVPTDPNADPVSYYFYYTDDSTWTTNVIASPELSAPTFTIPATLTGGKWYWWKVKASDGYLSKFSNQTWRFAVSLPPSIPVLLVPSNGSQLRANDFLVWLLSTDPDAGDWISHYHLQLDDNANFSSPEIDMNNITTSSKATSLSLQISELPGYINLENKIYFWRISAIDGFGIESDFSDGSKYFQYLLDVSIKLFIEGPMDGTTMNSTLNGLGLIPFYQPYSTAPWNYMEYEHLPSLPNPDVVDWILLELRNSTGSASTATNILYRKAALLLKNGVVSDVDGNSSFLFPVSFDDNVYMVVYHRNHLGIISELTFTPSSGSYYYDFSSGADKVLGGLTGYKELSPGIWGMAAGDANADGLIDLTDKLNYWSQIVGKTGYLNADFNMDGQADNPDKNEMWLDNNGKVSQVPE